MPSEGPAPRPDAPRDAAFDFVRITAHEDDGRAVIEGSIALPALPVCHIRMRADADRLYRYGAGREALFNYIREALREDAVSELPYN
ncbi:MAG TPA: hypothetical protein VD962_03715 [Rubricoccaceae bacterium]|nr:hypothetical protein [Rubricoccaceae bacterium]